MADMSIKQGGWAGLNISLRVVRGVPPKCDTNPLTACRTSVLYSPPTGQSPTLNPRRNHNPGGTPAPAHPRTQRPSPSQRAALAAPRLKRKWNIRLRRAAISSSKGLGSPSPQPSGDGRSIDSKQHVGLRDQPTRRTSHTARSSQRYAHSPRIYGALQCRARQGPSCPRL